MTELCAANAPSWTVPSSDFAFITLSSSLGVWCRFQAFIRHSGSVVHPGPLVVKFKVSCAPMSGTRPLAYILHASRPHNCIDGTIMTSSTRESWSKYFYRRRARDLCLLSYSGPIDLSRDLRTANWRLSRESQALFMQVRTMIGAYVSVHFK